MTVKEEQAQALLQDIARDIKATLPEGMGFVMLAFEFDEKLPKGSEKRMLYVSNANREDIKKSMLEWIEKTNGQFGKEVL